VTGSIHAVTMSPNQITQLLLTIMLSTQCPRDKPRPNMIISHNNKVTFKNVDK